MTNDQSKTVDFDIPVWRKYTLSVQEAAKYFRIGDKKMRKLIEENPGANYILWNGTRPQIKRRLFEQYLDEYMTAI
ncbi:excisionase [bacterium]|nr:excisionase [bacterium]MDY3087326.1 excisionase [Blautia sp.]